MSISPDKPTIVLVHGAFADATGWQHVILLLEAQGYFVVAVQNALTSLSDDIATTKRVIDAQSGPVVVVGHSYGGMVITGAAAGNPHVKSLVYVAAYIPDLGEAIGQLNEMFSPPPLATSIVPDAAGFLYVDRSKFHDVFCHDVPDAEARIMAATQKPINSVSFGQSLEAVAWKEVPSWSIVAKADNAINPDLERFMSQRANATTIEVDASHVPFISQPQVVVDVIKDAAQ